MAAELWQAYHETGEPDMSKGITKEESRSGILHGSAHVWLWRCSDQGIEVLLQRRSSTIATWPGYLDVSAAGHIDFGETPAEAALRETREELGMNGITEGALSLAFTHAMKNMRVPNTEYIENELQWVYLLAFDATDVRIVPDGKEVEHILWVDIPGLKKLIDGNDPHLSLVPHGKVYFDKLIGSLRRAAE